MSTLRGFFDAGQYSELHGEFISSEHTQLRALAASFGLKLDNVNKYPPRTRPQANRLRFDGQFWSQAALDREWHGWARELTFEGPAPEAIARDFLRSFDTMFPGLSAAYEGKAYYAWSSGDPHVGGAYSYLRVGQYTGFNGIQGRPHGNLHFGGEHTSNNFRGYMEGARSGYRCAREIALT